MMKMSGQLDAQQHHNWGRRLLTDTVVNISAALQETKPQLFSM
jgi:hypothetical protein